MPIHLARDLVMNRSALFILCSWRSWSHFVDPGVQASDDELVHVYNAMH